MFVLLKLSCSIFIFLLTAVFMVAFGHPLIVAIAAGFTSAIGGYICVDFLIMDMISTEILRRQLLKVADLSTQDTLQRKPEMNRLKPRKPAKIFQYKSLKKLEKPNIHSHNH